MNHSTPTPPHRTTAATFFGALLLVLAGCGGGGDGDDAAPVDPPGAAGPAATLPTSIDYAAAAKPLDVVAVLDATAVQELDVPIAGATLVVTGANGTRYTLLIPDNALRSPTRIRMQAVGALTGAPAGIDAVHGVQLEPRGLHFLSPATLTIEPAVAVPPARQAFYAYQGTGSDLHATWGELGVAAQIQVRHFSGYGMATLARERSVSGVFVDVVPAGLEARLRAATAQAFMDARAGLLTPAQLSTAVDALLSQYERDVLRLMHDGAGRSCANAITTFSAELSNARTRQLLGFAETSSSEAQATLTTLRSVCFEEANRRCRVSGNIEELVVAHRGLERQAQLLAGADAAATAREETAIDKCGRYEFQFDSTVTYDGLQKPSPIGFGLLSVKSRVPLALASTFDLLEGDAPIDYTDIVTRFNCPDVGCSYYLVQKTHADTAKVRRGLPRFTPLQDIDVWALGTPVAQTGTFAVEFDPGRLGEDIDVLTNFGPPIGVVNGNQASGRPPTPETFWSGYYSLVNQAEVNAAGFYAWSTDWTQPTYPVMFQRSASPFLVNPVLRLTTSTTARLVHKPI